jgi:hypothetical protein
MRKGCGGCGKHRRPEEDAVIIANASAEILTTHANRRRDGANRRLQPGRKHVPRLAVRKHPRIAKGEST